MTLLQYFYQRSVKQCSARTYPSCIADLLIKNDLRRINTKSVLRKDEGDNEKSEKLKIPEEPQNCCMSGCANCVWIAYAEQLAELFQDGGETAKQKILENIKDPNLRAFLFLELDDLFKKKGK